MAGRPDFTPERQLSAEQLADMRNRFARLSTLSLQHAYAEALERCKLGRDGRPPRSSLGKTASLTGRLAETKRARRGTEGFNCRTALNWQSGFTANVSLPLVGDAALFGS